MLFRKILELTHNQNALSNQTRLSAVDDFDYLNLNIRSRPAQYVKATKQKRPINSSGFTNPALKDQDNPTETTEANSFKPGQELLNNMNIMMAILENVDEESDRRNYMRRIS